MKEEQHLLLQNSFVYRGEAENVLFSSERPEKYDNSNLCKFIQEFFPSNLTIEELFSQIEEDHISSKKNLYIIPRRAVIIPQVPPENSMERVQFAKTLLQNVFDSDLLSKSAEVFQPPNSALSPYQRYVISIAFSHFHRLLTNQNVYTDKKSKDELVRSIFRFFNPDINNLNIPRLISNSNLDNKLITIISQSKVLVGDEVWDINPDETLQPFTNNTLPLISPTGQNINVKLQGISSSIFESAFSYEPNSFLTILNLCHQQFKNDQQLLEAFSSIIGSLDTRFLQVIFSILVSNSPVFSQLQTIYRYAKKELFYYKQLAYLELYSTVDLNAIFRQNTNYIRALNSFVKEECQEFKSKYYDKMISLISAQPLISIEKAKEKDVEIADKMIKDFFEILIKSVNDIPIIIRNLIRFMRLLSETLWLNPDLIYRSTFSIFLLRYISPILSEPRSDDIRITTKAVQFTKLMAKVGQMNVSEKDKSLMNKMIINNFKEAVKFYEEMVKIPQFQESKHVTSDDAIKAIKAFKSFVLENENELLKESEKKYNPHTNIFVDEYLSEIIARSNTQ